MNAREREDLVLRVVDDFLDQEIDMLQVYESLEGEELSDSDAAEVWEESNDLIRSLRDRTDMYYT